MVSITYTCPTDFQSDSFFLNEEEQNKARLILSQVDDANEYMELFSEILNKNIEMILAEGRKKRELREQYNNL